MSIQIKSLTTGAPVLDHPGTEGNAPNEAFNIIPTADQVYTLYAAVNASGIMKSAIVKGIRIINTHTAAVTVTLWFNRPPPGTDKYRRRLLAPADIALPPGASLIDDSEITLEPGDKIQAKASVANVIQYLISGVERDVV